MSTQENTPHNVESWKEYIRLDSKQVEDDLIFPCQDYQTLTSNLEPRINKDRAKLTADIVKELEGMKKVHYRIDFVLSDSQIKEDDRGIARYNQALDDAISIVKKHGGI